MFSLTHKVSLPVVRRRQIFPSTKRARFTFAETKTLFRANKYPVWLLVAFLLSVLVRLPSLNRPLSKHHEFNAAMVLVGCEGWAANGGAQKTNFTPLINFPNAGDVYYLEHPQVKNGKLHYLSFGPGQFLVPYAIGRWFGIPYTPLLLQIINLLAHLLSAWLVYRIARLLLGDTGKKPAVWAALLFLFTAETLWFFGNGYVHESLVMPFFAAALYLSLNLLTGHRKITTGKVVLLGAVVFAGIFFDWLLLFVAAGTGIATLIRALRGEKQYWRLFAGTAIAALLATACIGWLYGEYYGWNRFLNLLLNKYANRNGLTGEEGRGTAAVALALVKHFATGYLPLLLLLVAALFAAWRKKARLSGALKLLLWLHVPVLAYFLAFASFSAEHDYSVLKFALLFAVFAAWGIKWLPERKWQTAAVAFSVLVNVLLYYYINPPGKKGFNGDEYALEKNAGLSIKNNSRPDEWITQNMTGNNWLSVYYYSQRNNMYMPDADSAKRFFATIPAKRMVFFDFSHTGMVKIVRAEK